MFLSTRQVTCQSSAVELPNTSLWTSHVTCLKFEDLKPENVFHVLPVTFSSLLDAAMSLSCLLKRSLFPQAEVSSTIRGLSMETGLFHNHPSQLMNCFKNAAGLKEHPPSDLT